MTTPLRNFEPGNAWSNPDGTLTQRAQGWTRSVFDYIGAKTGTIPVTSIGGDGATTSTFLREDGNFAVPDYPVGANPTASIGTAVVNGTAVTFMRSDGAPAIDLGITPTWTGSHTFTAASSFSTLTTTGLAAVASLTTTTSATVGTGFGCNGKTAQTAAAVGAAVVATAATNVVPYGYATQAQADDIVTRLNTIRAALIANGILV